MKKTNYENYQKYGSATAFLRNAKPVPFDSDDFDLVLVSSDGQSIYNLDTQHFLKPDTVNGGYKRVTVRNSRRKKFRPYVHKLVASAFWFNPLNKKEVHHIDLNRQNNAFYNLLWVTHEEHVLLHQLWDSKLERAYWKLVRQLQAEQIRY